jgi:uncharacterized damage-inducible protein DinB
MTNREFYLQRMKAELPAFLKVLKALPKDKLDYKPHERSPSAEQIAWMLTSEHKACVDAVTQGQAEWNILPAPPLEEMIEKFETSVSEIIQKVSQIDDAAWEKQVQFFYEGKVVSERPAGEFLWFILFDAIHHRGQLSTYLRPMGGKVPSIYGPSADDPGT